jgi:hypothetical protein
MQTKFASRSHELHPGTPDAPGTLLAQDLARSAKVITEANINPD